MTIYHLIVVEDGEPICFGFFDEAHNEEAYDKADEFNDEFYEEASYSRAYVIEGEITQ